jgi:hypothetical protein
MPELYQIIGAVLRDVAQARFMSDRYSRQISNQYEKDSLMRTFPVPRVEIDEVEFDLHFGITSVAVDEARRTSQNTAIGALFDAYSISITRAGLAEIRGAVQEAAAKSGDPAQKAAADQLEKTFLSDENRERLRGRLLRYFNDNAEELTKSGELDVDKVNVQVEQFKKSLDQDPDLIAAQKAIPIPGDGWTRTLDEAKKKVGQQVGRMAEEMKAVKGRYFDYKIEVEVSPDALRDHPAVSQVRVKSRVKNYRWSKVDVDPADLRNLRTLTPE